MENINLIQEKNNNIIKYLNKFITKNIIDIISEYSGGFVEIGKLDDDVFRGVNFIENYISYKIKYIHHLDLYFINFWEMDNKEHMTIYYPAGWWVRHHSFIINPSKCKLLYDKVMFFIYTNGKHLDKSTAIYPIYDNNKLKKEYFETYDISTNFLNKILNNIKPDKKDSLIYLFNLLTEYIKYPNISNDPYIFNSISYIQKKEEYYENITLPFILFFFMAFFIIGSITILSLIFFNISISLHTSSKFFKQSIL